MAERQMEEKWWVLLEANGRMDIGRQVTKARNIQKGIELDIEYTLKMSCPGPTADGLDCCRCVSCRRLNKGLVETTVPDITVYAVRALSPMEFDASIPNRHGRLKLWYIGGYLLPCIGHKAHNMVNLVRIDQNFNSVVLEFS